MYSSTTICLSLYELMPAGSSSRLLIIPSVFSSMFIPISLSAWCYISSWAFWRLYYSLGFFSLLSGTTHPSAFQPPTVLFIFSSATLLVLVALWFKKKNHFTKVVMGFNLSFQPEVPAMLGYVLGLCVQYHWSGCPDTSVTVH